MSQRGRLCIECFAAPAPVDGLVPAPSPVMLSELEEVRAENADLRAKMEAMGEKGRLKALEAENAELRERLAAKEKAEGPDLGDEASDELLRKCLQEARRARRSS